MATGRVAANEELVRPAPIFLDVFRGPGEGQGHVTHMLGVLDPRREPIVDHQSDALAGQLWPNLG